MAKRMPVHATDLRGYSRLAVDATIGLTELVENLHHNILRVPGPLGTPTQAPAKGITGFVYRTIRGVTRVVGRGIDAALAQLTRLLGAPDDSTHGRDALLAALNGVLGDHLAASGNPLAIPMQLRVAGQALTLTSAALQVSIAVPTSRILLLVHGLCMNDLQWQRHGHDHGVVLAAELGYTPVYVRYNSGLHISSNGRELADLIEGLLRAWPVPPTDLVIVAHSMGGLVSRSACHYAQNAGHDWLRQLRAMFFLGTPHSGAPLERGGSWVDTILGASPYSAAFARLGKIRSAGITDLRHANLLDEDWQGADRFARTRRKPAIVPLPSAVRCHALAAVLAHKSGVLAERVVGDGLVPLQSALGQHRDPRRCVPFPKSRQWVGYGMSHLDLLDRPEVYVRMRRSLAKLADSPG